MSQLVQNRRSRIYELEKIAGLVRLTGFISLAEKLRKQAYHQTIDGSQRKKSIFLYLGTYTKREE